MKLIQGPMATLSHEAFRRAIQRFGGCDEYWTEMINATSLINMGPFEKYYLLAGPDPEKIVWQLTGWESESIIKAAQVLCQQPGLGIDINMACSAPQIYKTGAGISWMTKPVEEVAKVVSGVKNQILKFSPEKRLSVKCRLGNDDWTEESFFNFTDTLIENGVTCIALHARTKREKLARCHPKWEYCQKLKERYSSQNIQIYLNGDIKDAPTFSLVQTKAPDVDGFMISRQAAIEPWIFSKLKKYADKNQTDSTPAVDRMQCALDFVDDVQECQPKEFWPTRIQRFFAYYCSQFFFAHDFARRITNFKGLEATKEEIKSYFQRNPDEQFKAY